MPELKYELRLYKVKPKEKLWERDHEVEALKADITEEQYKAIAKVVLGGRS